jgi:hypothetical protein
MIACSTNQWAFGFEKTMLNAGMKAISRFGVRREKNHGCPVAP